METLFGRKKFRPRMSSVSGPPNPVSRPVTAANISAPITNPTLTANGTNFSLSLPTIQRLKVQRKREIATINASIPRPSSPDASVDNSSTVLSESTDTDTTTNEQPNPLLSFVAQTQTLRESGSSAEWRSPPIRDSSRALSPIPPTPPSSSPPSSVNLTPTSSATPPDNPSSSYTQSESHFSHSHNHFPHPHRGIMDSFYLSRPDDEEIEAMFQNIVRTRDLTNLPPLTIDQKWSMVESDERLRWKDETREEQAKKIPEQSRNGMIEERSPEWYLMKFMDRSITPKDASGLLVSLRGHELGWFQQFIAIQGTRVLTQFISYLSRKGKQRTEADHQLEYETLRCIKQILNSWPATQDALTHNLLVSQIASSLNSPRLASRKLVVEILTFLAYRVPESLNLITGALETVSITNNVGSSPYAYWFASFERSLSGRGKMGSLVGASDEVRKNAATESNINEYAVTNLLLVNAILENSDDLDLRIHHHSQMATAGLNRVIDLCRGFNFELLNTQLDKLQDTIELDEKELRERLDQEILRDMTNIEDVYAALKSQTHNTKAHDYLLSILQHLLLIREDGPGILQYYQLLDSLVTDVVMDHKLSGAEQRLGKSVERIISQFNDADQYRVLEAEAAKMRADIRRLQLEKEILKGEMIEGGHGLVGILKRKIAILEETNARLQAQLEAQKSDQERINELESRYLELFQVLKEPSVESHTKE